MTPENLSIYLDRIRLKNPLIHSLTNHVVMNSTANALLALGARPVMSHTPEEFIDLTRSSSAMLINIGTADANTAQAMCDAAELAQKSMRAWVLDPVGAGASRFRTDLANKLKKFHPTVIRGNASEIASLAGATDIAPRGVDSTAEPEQVLDFGKKLASETGAIVAITGGNDLITDGQKCFMLCNGHKLLTQCTGTGCVASAFIAAYLGLGLDGMTASTVGLASLEVAAEEAAKTAKGPGSFQVHLLDEIAALSADKLKDEVRISWHT